MPVRLSQWSFERLERGAFWLLLWLHLVPVWSFRYFASTDGPAHLYNAWVLKTMLLHPESAFHTLLAFNHHPEPNYLYSALLVGLLTALPPWLADKLVLTLYVAGLPLAGRYLVRSWQPAAGFLAVLAFPLVYSAVLQWGFYNFCLSLVLLLLVLGYWRRHVARPGRPWVKSWLGLLGLITLLYLAHPLAYLTGGLLLGLLMLEHLLTRPAAARSWPAHLSLVALAFLPTLPLQLWYFWRKGSSSPVTTTNLADHFLDWLVLEPLRYMGAAERVYRFLFVLLLLLVVLYALRQHRRGRAVAPAWAWGLGTLLLGLGYVLVPEAIAGGSIVRPRLGLLSYLTLLGGLATVVYTPRVRCLLLVAGAGVAIGFLGFRFGQYRTLHSGLADYCSAAAYIRPNTTLAPLQLAFVSRMPNGKDYHSYINPFEHASGYVAVERQLLTYENYEANTGYFPLVWRPGQERLSEPDSLPRRLNVTPRPGSAAPDYVLLWGARDTTARFSVNRYRILAQLDSFYRPVYRSPTGLVLLYEHRAAPAR